MKKPGEQTATITVTPASLGGDRLTLSLQMQKGAKWGGGGIYSYLVSGPWSTLSRTHWGVREYGIYRLRAYIDKTHEHEAGSSNWLTFKVMSLTPPAVPSRVRADALIESWGTFKPPQTAEQNRNSIRVYCERYYGGRWNPVYEEFAHSYRNTSSSTRYSAALRCVAGSFRIRAVHAAGDLGKTTSSWRRFTAY